MNDTPDYDYETRCCRCGQTALLESLPEGWILRDCDKCGRYGEPVCYEGDICPRCATIADRAEEIVDASTKAEARQLAAAWLAVEELGIEWP